MTAGNSSHAPRDTSVTDAPAPSRTADTRPSEQEQREARRKQEAAEESFRPEDAEWAEEATERDADVLFRAIFERSAVGIALVDLQSRISKCNPALTRMLGYAHEELVGKAFTDISHPEDAAVDQSLFEDLMAGRSDHYTVEKRYARKDGSFLPGQMTASVIAGSDGIPKFVIGIIEDVSERHRAEKVIRQRDRQIREAYTQVIAAVTGGKLVLMAPEEIDGELGEEAWHAEPVTSAGELSKRRRELQARIAERFDDVCDPADLTLAAGEAMANALKHGSHVRVCVFEKAGLPQIEVDDDGPGIDFTHLPKATFVPGYSTTTSLGMGFTIMLAACERVLLATSDEGTRIVLEGRPQHARS